MAQHHILENKDFYKAINPTVISCGFHKAEPKWDSGPIDKIMNDLDIWYIIKGSGSVRISDNWYDFTAGDVVTIHPGQIYERETAAHGYPFEMFYTHILPFETTEAGYHKLLQKCWPNKIPLHTHPDIERLFNHLFEACTTQPAGVELLTKAIAGQILYLIFNALQKTQYAETHLPPSYSKLLKAKQYISEHYHEELTLEEIAEFCDLSISYLSTLSKHFLGISPIDYQISLRLRAAKLLLAKDIPVKSVAQTTGFNSIYHFSRIFKKKIGISPSNFAAMHRKK
jgi:AraC family transcriptional regulator, transcriptional activator for feuABC-ybbA operon